MKPCFQPLMLYRCFPPEPSFLQGIMPRGALRISLSCRICSRVVYVVLRWVRRVSLGQHTRALPTHGGLFSQGVPPCNRDDLFLLRDFLLLLIFLG